MIDILGHPIEVGTTVLTNAYYSPAMTERTVVDKITKKAVYVTINAWSWKYDHVVGRGVYSYFKKQLRRRPDQVIVIDKQLEFNQKTYPENMI